VQTGSEEGGRQLAVPVQDPIRVPDPGTVDVSTLNPPVQRPVRVSRRKPPPVAGERERRWIRERVRPSTTVWTSTEVALEWYKKWLAEQGVHPGMACSVKSLGRWLSGEGYPRVRWKDGRMGRMMEVVDGA
jgi:hypothetical protein